MEHKKHSGKLRHILAAPFIWMPAFPLILLDIFLELYHRTCFPLYGITIVERKKYIRIDRHKLQYLNMGEKVFCAYCGYANGLLHYASVIAGETERYWCGIKHKQGDEFIASPHHNDFLEYGDEETFKEKIVESAK